MNTTHQDDNAPEGADGATLVPQDAQIVRNILDSAKIKDYDPRVVDQLLSFMHSYTSQVLQDAQEISKQIHASAPGSQSSVVVGTDDIALATRLQGHHSFVQPPSLQDVGTLAAHVNRVPLPEIETRHGLRIPPNEMDCLTNPNIQVPRVEKKPKQGTTRKTQQTTGSTMAHKDLSMKIDI
jgi:hypothetical protein